MPAYGVTVRWDTTPTDVVALSEVTLTHHKVSAVRLGVPTLSGGHLLHLALAMCLFNDVMTLAQNEGMTLTDLQVWVDGGFEGGQEPRSTGMRYDVRLVGDADDSRLRDMVARAARDSIIGHVLRTGAPVAAGSVQVAGD